MDTIQETPSTQPDLQVLGTAVAQELALTPHEGMTATPREGRHLILSKQATLQEVSDAMDGVLGTPSPEPASQRRFNDYKNGSFEKQNVLTPVELTSLADYMKRRIKHGSAVIQSVLKKDDLTT